MNLLGPVLAQIDLLPTGQFSNLGQITMTSLISAAVILILVIAALVFSSKISLAQKFLNQ